MDFGTGDEVEGDEDDANGGIVEHEEAIKEGNKESNGERQADDPMVEEETEKSDDGDVLADEGVGPFS